MRLDTAYFTKNWKLITENTVAKYFFIATNYCSPVFSTWLVHEQCHGPAKINARKQTHPKYPFGLVWFSYAFCVFDIGQWVPCIIHRTHKLSNSANFSSKLGSMVLFTHFKIILLQYFQFSIFNNKRYSNIPKCTFLLLHQLNRGVRH